MTTETEIVKNLTQWIRDAQHDPEIGGGEDLTRLELKHAGARGEEMLYSLKDISSHSEPDELARSLYNKGEKDAESLGGAQTYAVHSFHGKNRKKTSIFRFRILAENPFGMAEDHSMPIEKQLVRSSQNHTEKMAGLLIKSQEDIQTHYRSIIRQQQERIEFLEKKDMETREAYEQLISLQHERDMERAKVIASEERKDEMVKMARELGPIAVNRLAGKKVFDAPDPLTKILSDFVSGISMEQLMAMASAGNLSEVQKIQLMTLVDTVLPNKG